MFGVRWIERQVTVNITTSSQASSRASSKVTAIFSHENLKVYPKALLFAQFAHAHTLAWDSMHAIADHLPRAADSVVENIATASASFFATKQTSLDVSLGSALECAACLDIAQVKHLTSRQDAGVQKTELLSIYRMLIGLRRSWSESVVREAGVAYGNDGHELTGSDGRLNSDGPDAEKADAFSHERLDVYRLALETMAWFNQIAQANHLNTGEFRKLDNLLTSVVLNIAEGNGRFSASDHRRFVGIAHTSAVKTAAHFDLCILNGSLKDDCMHSGKRLLARISKMTIAMISKLDQ